MRDQSQTKYLHIIVTSISIMDYKLVANFCIPGRLIYVTEKRLKVLGVYWNQEKNSPQRSY